MSVNDILTHYAYIYNMMRRTQVDADTETEMIWSNMCIPFAPASPYSVPVTPLAMGPIREVGMSPLTRGRGDAPFFPEDHFQGDAAAEVVGGGVRLVSGPLEHSGAEKGKPAEGKEGSPSLGRSGEKRVSDKMESEGKSAAELGDEFRGQMQLGEGRKRGDEVSREVNSRKEAAQGESVGFSRRMTCGGERSSGGGREGILRPGRNLREAPSTRVSDTRTHTENRAPMYLGAHVLNYLHYGDLAISCLTLLSLLQASRLKQSAPAKKRTEKVSLLVACSLQLSVCTRI